MLCERSLGESIQCLVNALTGQVAHSTAGCCHPPPLRVGVLNIPQGVALVTTRSGQTPPTSKFVLGFPGFHRHHGNSFGLGTFSSALALVDVKNWSRRRNLRRKAAEMGLR